MFRGVSVVFGRGEWAGSRCHFPTTTMHVLVVDPSKRTGQALERALGEQILPAEWVEDAARAAALATRDHTSAVVIAHDPPRCDGLTLLRALRALEVRAPLFLLLRRRDTACVIDGLGAGADDVLFRPVSIDELAARIRRRASAQLPRANDVLRYGPVSLDLHAKRTFIEGQEVLLRRREIEILHVLLLHPGQVLSRSQLLSHVWGSIDTPYGNVVDVQILRLRKALGQVGRSLIHTIRGFGYRLGD